MLAHGPQIVTDGLVLALDAGDSNSYPGPLTEFDPYFSNVSLLLHMDGSNGSTTFTDSSSNALSVTANGGAQISTAQSKFGGTSGYFDGSGDYLTVTDNSVFELGSGNFTIECWIYLTAGTGSYRCIIAKSSRSDGSGSGSFVLQISTSNKLHMLFDSDAGPAWDIDVQGTTTVALNSWHHVAIVRSGTSFTGYLNGIQECSATSPIALVDNAEVLTIGTLGYISGTFVSYLTGYIDDLRITKGICRYNSSFTPPTAPFSNSPPNTWYDLSGNGNHGTLVNGPTYDSSNGGNIVFDGTSQYVNSISGYGLRIFTVGFWVKTSESRSNGTYWQRQTFFGKASNGNASGDFGITISDGYLGYWSGLTSDASYLSSIKINDNKWKYIVCVNDGNYINLYLDGNIISGSQLSSGGSLDSANFWIAARGSNDGYTGAYCSCSFCTFAFYNRVLTSQEIQQNYNALKGRFGL